jgi:hypothetical protein
MPSEIVFQQPASLGRVRPLAPNEVLEAERSWREQQVFRPRILAWPAPRPARVPPSLPPSSYGLSKLLPLTPPLSLKTPRLADQARGAQSKPCRYIRGQGRTALGGAQVLCGRLAGPSICNNLEQNCLSFVEAALSTALICTKTSLLPSSG